MANIKLLDCTLRDGGYINDWDFGQDTIISIFERLVSANVDIIEVGFLDERRMFDQNRSIMPDTQSVKKIYGKLDKKNTMVLAMIDYGTCSIEQIESCNYSYLNGIRVIFKKFIRKEAILFCKQLKEKGYLVFVQAVSITSYTDKELLDLIDMVNELEPYALSLVDTYGLLHQNHLIYYVELLDHNLKKNIGIGYHSHNNFQMGYANCISFLNYHTKRTLIVDGTLYGMGKSAGNTPIELLTMYLNSNAEKQYDIKQILEAIDSNIMGIYCNHSWGYNMLYYISALNDCHPNYVKYLMEKHTLSIKSINEILALIDPDKKLLYDKKYIEEQYFSYQKIVFNDSETIKELIDLWNDKEILVLGPGRNIILQEKNILNYIQEKNPIVLAINFIPDNIHVQFIFISNSKRYVQLSKKLLDKEKILKTIATSNVTKTMGTFNYVLDYCNLIDKEAKIIDNSLIMLLKILQQIQVKEIALAGFDGYSLIDNHNYYNPAMEYLFQPETAKYINQYVVNKLKEWKQNIRFITTSIYNEFEVEQ